MTVNEQFQCKVKATRKHNSPCRCKVPGSVHNRSWRVERGEKVWC